MLLVIWQQLIGLKLLVPEMQNRAADQERRHAQERFFRLLPDRVQHKLNGLKGHVEKWTDGIRDAHGVPGASPVAGCV